MYDLKYANQRDNPVPPLPELEVAFLATTNSSRLVRPLNGLHRPEPELSSRTLWTLPGLPTFRTFNPLFTKTLSTQTGMPGGPTAE